MKHRTTFAEGVVIILKWATIIGLNVIGLFGLCLFIYGLFPKHFPLFTVLNYFHISSHAATTISHLLTIFGFSITSFSIYLPLHRRPADLASKVIVVPLIVTPLIIISTYIAFSTPLGLSDHTITGMAILGLTGAILRVLPFTEERAYRSKKRKKNESGQPRHDKTANRS